MILRRGALSTVNLKEDESPSSGAIVIRLDFNADIASCSCFHVKSGVNSEGLQFYITLLKMRDIITTDPGETNCQGYNGWENQVLLLKRMAKQALKKLIIGFDLTTNWPNSEILLLLYIAKPAAIAKLFSILNTKMITAATTSSNFEYSQSYIN